MNEGETARLLTILHNRIIRLHPALADVRFTHKWGGPILIADQWRPVFQRHPKNDRHLVLGAYSGHGVALSVYLGAWAAQVLLKQRSLPAWNA